MSDEGERDRAADVDAPANRAGADPEVRCDEVDDDAVQPNEARAQILKRRNMFIAAAMSGLAAAAACEGKATVCLSQAVENGGGGEGGAWVCLSVASGPNVGGAQVCLQPDPQGGSNQGGQNQGGQNQGGQNQGGAGGQGGGGASVGGQNLGGAGGQGGGPQVCLTSPGPGGGGQGGAGGT